jgi:hypothetical protein
MSTPLAAQVAALILRARDPDFDNDPTSPAGYGRLVELTNELVEDVANAVLERVEQMPGPLVMCAGLTACERGLLATAILFLGDRCGVPQLAEALGAVAVKLGLRDLVTPRLTDWAHASTEWQAWIRDAAARLAAAEGGGR